MEQTDAATFVRLGNQLIGERKQGIRWPSDVYETTLRLMCPAAFEAVIPRWVPDGTLRGSLEVWLAQRGANEPAFPGMWHGPGTYFLPGESDEDTALRLIDKELRPARLVKSEQVTSINLCHDLRFRASTRSVIFCCWLDGIPAEGRWWRVDRLDKLNLIDSHHEIIALGLAPFLRDPRRFY